VEKDHDNCKKWNEPGKNAPGGDRIDVHTHPLEIAESTSQEMGCGSKTAGGRFAKPDQL
jgi:hypothetical protein